MFEFMLNTKEMMFQPWKTQLAEFQYSPSMPFFQLVVPTVDTTRFTFALETLININKRVFFTGNTGVGKSIVIQKFLEIYADNLKMTPIPISFSAQTSSAQTQKTIESKLSNKSQTEKQVSGGKKCTIFVDDVNMPAVEEYGAQPPIELLRQLIDHGGYYERPAFLWKTIFNFTMICAAAPPSGGRAALTPRFMRHFHIICLPDPSDDSLRHIFNNITQKFFD